MLNFELVGICSLNTWRLNFDKVESAFHKDDSYQIQLHSGGFIMLFFNSDHCSLGKILHA